MNEQIQKLVQCLNLEVEHYRSLFSLAEKQKELLVAGDVETLAGNIRQQEKEVFALGPLVALRDQLLLEIATVCGVKKMTLMEVIEKSPREMVEELKSTIVRLVQSAKKLEDINRVNEKLLHNAVSYVDFTLKIIADGGKRKSFYPSDKPVQESKPSYVDKVV